MMRRLFLAAMAIALFNFTYAQDSPRKPLDLVSTAKKSGEAFETTNVFQLDLVTSKADANIEDRIQEYSLLDINPEQLQALRESQPTSITLRLPTTFADQLEIELVKVDIFSPDFSVIRRSDNTVVDVNHGVFYRGIIKGNENSIAAISVFDNEIRGLISSPTGNIVLGKLQGRNDTKHIIYDDFTVITDLGLDCGTAEDGIGYKRSDLMETEDSRAPGDCIRLYMEVDKDIHDQKGGVTPAANYTTGLMNEVITIYSNESIVAVVSQIVVWDVTSPYSSTSSSGMLSDFQGNVGSFNGDLGQLLSYQASGGIAAGFSGICNSNSDNSLSFSSINSTYSVVPTYSWTVMVVSHEFGHLWGSRHTHACVWNGNNTAIDGCAGATEGSCSLPGYPSQGGTMMSYCHLQSVGINFNEGFGPQPGNVIRNSVTNASCTSSCGPPTCTDGIQNGNETGVDCGGPDCPACPSCSDGVQNGDEEGVDCGGSNCAPCPCNGTNVTVSITLDNYPEETSWTITNSGGGVVASGGTYGSEPDGSTVNIVACLPDGCYDFNISDSYGDGICCGYGNGSYTVSGGGTTHASGGNFGSSETTNFCLGGGPAPTCSDGIQNGDETGVDCGGATCPACPTCNDGIQNGDETDVDCGGPDCPACPTCSDGIQNGDETGVDCGGPDCPACPTCNDGIQNGDETGVDCGGSCDPCDGGGDCTYQTISFHDFESGWGIWNDGGSDCRRSSNDANYSYSGSYSARIRDNTNSSVTTTDNLNLTAYEEITVDWIFYSRSMETNEDFWLQISTNGGSSYTTVAAYAQGANNSFTNNAFWSASVVIPGPFSSNTRVRFRNDASGNSDWIYIDDVTISGCLSAGGLVNPDDITVNTDFDNVESTLHEETGISIRDLRLFPNPTSNELSISFLTAQESDVMMVVTDLQGRQMIRQPLGINDGRVNSTLDVSNYSPGVYLVHVITDTGRTTEKFVVVR